MSEKTDALLAGILESLRENFPPLNAGESASREKLNSLFPAGDNYHRTVLTILSADVAGGSGENILPAATAVEYVRKGLATIAQDHAAGLALINAAYGLMFANSHIYAERAIQAHSELVACIATASVENSGEATLRLAVRVGAILGGADYLQLEGLSRFAGKLCEIYQSSRQTAEAGEGRTLTDVLEIEAGTRQTIHLVSEAHQSLAANFPNNDAAEGLARLAENLAAGNAGD